jgi:hypothetical protein
MALLIILANSRKNGQRCIAGRILRNGDIGPWLRPIGSHQREELISSERQYRDGSEPRLLDIVKLGVKDVGATRIHPENAIVDPGEKWLRRGTYGDSAQQLDLLKSPQRDLWLIGDSTSNGLNDRFQVQQAKPGHGSLRFIKVHDLRVHVGHEFDKWKTRASFTAFGRAYRLTVTDLTYDPAQVGQRKQNWKIGPAYLTVSLGQAWNGYYYKLVAAILRPR